MSSELYKEMIKDELKAAVESGQLNTEQYMTMIDITIKDIASIDDEKINTSIKEFKTDVKKITGEIMAKQKELLKEYQEVYEQLLKDL